MKKSITNRTSLRDNPYFDDVFSTDSNAKDYSQILFHPGRPLQSRELTQIQTLLNEKHKTFLDTQFKNGSIIAGLTIEYKNHKLIAHPGLIYWDGEIFKTDALEMSFTEDPSELNLVIVSEYYTISSGDDDSLNDPAVKYHANQSLQGADRLKIEFKLKKHEDLSPTNPKQFFNFADVTFNEGLITNIQYHNRNGEFVKFYENHSVYDNKIIDGLTIHQSNLTDVKLSNKKYQSIDELGTEEIESEHTLDAFNIFAKIPSLYNDDEFEPETETEESTDNIYGWEEPQIKENALIEDDGKNHIIVKKGIAELKNITLPITENKILPINKVKYDSDDDFVKMYHKLNYYKTSENSESGIYFKLFYELKDGALDGVDENYKFKHLVDPYNVRQFLVPGRKIQIEKRIGDEWKVIAKANICSLQSPPDRNSRHDWIKCTSKCYVDSTDSSRRALIFENFPTDLATGTFTDFSCFLKIGNFQAKVVTIAPDIEFSIPPNKIIKIPSVEFGININLSSDAESSTSSHISQVDASARQTLIKDAYSGKMLAEAVKSQIKNDMEYQIDKVKINTRTKPIEFSNTASDMSLEIIHNYKVILEHSIPSTVSAGTKETPIEVHYSYTNEPFVKVFFHNIEFLNGCKYMDLEPHVFEGDTYDSKPTRIKVWSEDENIMSSSIIQKGIKIRRTPDVKFDKENNSMYHDFAKIPTPFVKEITKKELTTLVEKPLTNLDFSSPLTGETNWGKVNFIKEENVLGVASIHGEKIKDRDYEEKLGGKSDHSFNYNRYFHREDQDTIELRKFTLEGLNETKMSFLIAGPEREKVDLESKTKIKKIDFKYYLEIPSGEEWNDESTDRITSSALFPGDYITVFADKPYFIMLVGTDVTKSIKSNDDGDNEFTKTKIDEHGILIFDASNTSDNVAITNFDRRILDILADEGFELEYDICRWDETIDPDEFSEEKHWIFFDKRKYAFLERATHAVYSPHGNYVKDKNHMCSGIVNFETIDYKIASVMQSFQLAVYPNGELETQELSDVWTLKSMESFFIGHEFSILNNSIDSYTINTGFAFDKWDNDNIKSIVFPTVSSGVGSYTATNPTSGLSVYDRAVTDDPIRLFRGIGVQYYHWTPLLTLPLTGMNSARLKFLNVYSDNFNILELSEFDGIDVEFTNEKSQIKANLLPYEQTGNYWKKYRHFITNESKLPETDTVLDLEPSDYKNMKIVTYQVIDSETEPYANIISNNEMIQKKNLTTNLHKPFIITKERFEQHKKTETITATEGKVIDFRHEIIEYHNVDALENQRIDLRGYQAFDYVAMIPDIVNLYLNDSGEIQTFSGQPSFVTHFSPIFNNEMLYLGTIINPPIYEDSNPEKNLNFMGFPKYFMNVNENIFDRIENYQLNKKIDSNTQALTLSNTHEYTRRDVLNTSKSNELIGISKFVSVGKIETEFYDFIGNWKNEDNDIPDDSEYKVSFHNFKMMTLISLPSGKQIGQIDVRAKLNDNWTDFPIIQNIQDRRHFFGRKRDFENPFKCDLEKNQNMNISHVDMISHGTLDDFNWNEKYAPNDESSNNNLWISISNDNSNVVTGMIYKNESFPNWSFSNVLYVEIEDEIPLSELNKFWESEIVGFTHSFLVLDINPFNPSTERTPVFLKFTSNQLIPIYSFHGIDMTFTSLSSGSPTYTSSANTERYRFQRWLIDLEPYGTNIFSGENPISSIDPNVELHVQFYPLIGGEEESIENCETHKMGRMNIKDSNYSFMTGETIRYLNSNNEYQASIIKSISSDGETFLIDSSDVIPQYAKVNVELMTTVLKEHEHYKRTQYLMNTSVYNIYNPLIVNEYIETQQFALTDDERHQTICSWSYDSGKEVNNVPSINLHNNEFSPRCETVNRLHLKWNEPENLKRNSGFIAIDKTDSVDLIDLGEQYSGELDINSPRVENKILKLNDLGIQVEDNVWDHNKIYLMDVLDLDFSDNHKVTMNDSTFIDEDIFSINSKDSLKKTDDFNYLVMNKIMPIQTNLMRFNYNRLFLTPRSLPITIKNKKSKNDIKKIQTLNLDGFYSHTALCVDSFNFNLTEYKHIFNDNQELNKYSDTCAYLVDGIYKTGVLNIRGMTEDNNKYYLSENWQIDRVLSKLKHASDFSSFSDHYDFLFKQIRKPLIFQTYLDSKHIESEEESETPHDFLSSLQDQCWHTYLPNAYQILHFTENAMISKIKIPIKQLIGSDGRFLGRIAVSVGFSEGNRVSSHNIIHTQVFTFGEKEELGELSINTNELELNFDVPIYVPSESNFFVSFLKEEKEENRGDIQLYYIENGSYDKSNELMHLISYPANFEGVMYHNNVEYAQRMIKMNIEQAYYTDKTNITHNIYSKTYSKTTNVGDSFDKIMIIGEDLMLPNTSIQYFYSLDEYDNDAPEKLWLECYLNDEIQLDETQTKIVFKCTIKTSDSKLMPLLRDSIILHFKKFKKNTIKLNWAEREDEYTVNTLNLHYNNLKQKSNYSEVIYDDQLIQKDMSAMSQVYRMIIDFSVPEMNNLKYDFSGFRGIPIIFRDAQSNNIIEKYSILKELYTKSIPIRNSESSSLWSFNETTAINVNEILTKTELKLGEKIVCNSDGTLWSMNDVRFGGNEETQMNLFGQVLYIQKVNENTFRQVYEFCGKDFEKHSDVIAEIQIPLFKGDSETFKTLYIKNVSFSSDCFNDNKNRIIETKYQKMFDDMKVYEKINPYMSNFMLLSRDVIRNFNYMKLNGVLNP